MLPTPEVLDTPFPWARPPIDPPTAYAWLRENEPIRRVTMNDGLPAWLITRYDDVRTLLADPRVSANTSFPGFPTLGIPKQPDDKRSFLRMDPPDHTVFRKLLARHFTVKKIEAMRPRIQQLVDDTIDELLTRDQHPVDLVEHFALPIPSTVLSWILGVPEADREFFNRASEELLNSTNPAESDAKQRGMAARDSMVEYIVGLAKQRSAVDDPGSDILGSLVGAAKEGTIPWDATVSTGVTLLVAGHETTANMTALGTATLLEHPEQLAELRADPDLLPGAIEELLRYLTIVHLIVLRVAKEDIEIGGHRIPAGEAIIPLNIAANRDDAHYQDADTFDLHRNPRDHLAFGFGVHQCLGQPLARVELQVIYETLLRRIPTLRLAVPAEELPYKRHALINGLFRLPVTW